MGTMDAVHGASRRRGNDTPTRKSLWIPAIFVGFMLVVIAVNATLIYFATHTFSGLDTERYYQEGVQYNTAIKEGEESAALGWSAQTEIQNFDGGRRLHVWIVDKAGLPVSGLTVEAHVVRPTSTAFDQVVTLRPSATEKGVYVAELTLPAVGVWDIRLAATGRQGSWQSNKRLFVK
jgi:nitrogen fixation protein FixH